ncbi:MAG TPA: FG-GAP-like repeat-containing protein [Verrucomicrobiae bacterium]|nr:FG-GAP-like repeat-containing protein [Verrucomicrobiae bacterium]
MAAKPPSPEEDAKVIRTLVDAEETCLKLQPKMETLSKGILNLKLPADAEGAAVFSPSVRALDLGAGPAGTNISNDVAELRAWPVGEAIKEMAPVDLWRTLLDQVSYFEHAKVYVITGEHPDGDMYRFDAAGGFDALAKMKSGEWRSLHGKLKLTWQRYKAAAGEPQPDWQITDWKTEEFDWMGSPQRLFVEALASAVRTPQEVKRLRHSQHYEETVKFYKSGMKTPPHPYFAPISANQKEGIAVADIDGDGFDDVYIGVRIGKNMLLHNNGDGTFTEEAAKYGLDLPGHTMCTIFADFDNDGDLDAMLGRSLLKSSYLENRNGQFFQPPIPPYMPMAVISMAAADYNGDGLLDIYMCTYRPAAPAGASPAGGVAQVDDSAFDWPDEFFPPDLARDYKRRVTEHRSRIGGTVLDQIGPPNVLLVNRGNGQFEVAPENAVVGSWRNTLQATWCDYNQDGRPDLYLANDWGMDSLFRNDGPKGFSDVSEEMGITHYGFAMGATFGDYDNDGLEDIYVSNMYSAPGRRMTRLIPGLDKMFIDSAEGNWLYHQEPNRKFKQVAGMEPPAMMVMNAGWSWGGCFADFDNDSFLDLYVLSGYFTAPKGFASKIDMESNLWRTMVRTDNNMSRQSFRFSPEWRRTSVPDNDGPEIDTRLGGAERHGEKALVHSLNGSERNHYFANRGGKSFQDISALSGLDNIGDSRGFALIDYDRDGWQDVALINANSPMFFLYRNEIAKLGAANGIVAVRFVGGNKTASVSKEFACRDGYGARVNIDLGDTKLTREHRCGEGWSTQNSPTMIVGIGGRRTVPSLSVKWPSGKTASTKDIPEGTLLTIYENPADSPTKEPFTQSTYRTKKEAPPASTPQEQIFAVRYADRAAKPARLRVYTTFTTWSAEYKKELSQLSRLKEELGPQGVDVVAVPIDKDDDNNKLGAYAKEFKPTSRFVNVSSDSRTNVYSAYQRALDEAPPLPSTVITDDAGHVLSAHIGVPSISEVRKHLR